jgi:hypothetical protein
MSLQRLQKQNPQQNNQPATNTTNPAMRWVFLCLKGLRNVTI